MQLQARQWMIISGLSWLGIGAFLTAKGIKIAPENGAWVLALALVVGYIKGRLVLSKAAHRITSRLAQLPSPIAISHIYDKKYLLLLASMVLLGITLRLLHIPTLLHAAIDLAIGSALIRGSIYFFRPQSLDLAQKK